MPFLWNEFSVDCTRCLKLFSSRSIFALRSLVSGLDRACGSEVNGVVTSGGGGVVGNAGASGGVMVEACMLVAGCGGSEGVVIAEVAVVGLGTSAGCGRGVMVSMSAF